MILHTDVCPHHAVRPHALLYTVRTVSPNVFQENARPRAQRRRLPDFLVRNVRAMKYARPTPIQRRAVPLALAGRDLMCCAQADPLSHQHARKHARARARFNE